MFRACTIDEITEVLAKKPEQFFDEREELDDLAFEDNTEYYRSEDCLLVVSPGRIRAEMYAMPLTPDFDLGKLEAFASKRAQSFRMHLNVTGLDPDALRFAEPYDISDAVLSLAASKPADEVPGKPRPVGKIRELNKNDARYTRNFPQKDHGSFMGLGRVFSLLVEDESGVILGYFTPDGSLKAYLSYVPSAQGELVLDDLYVQQGERLKGVGTALAKAFVTRSLKEGEFAYWPVAATEEARKTAEAAGFTVCASRIVLETF